MKFAAAYLLACLGAEQAAAAAALPAPAPALPPTKDDVRRILGSVGAEVEEDRLDLLFALMDGKDVAELIAAGREQLAYAPSGAAVVAAPAAKFRLELSASEAPALLAYAIAVHAEAHRLLHPYQIVTERARSFFPAVILTSDPRDSVPRLVRAAFAELDIDELTNTASGVAAAAPLGGDAVASDLTIAVHTKCSTPGPNPVEHALVSLCIEELGFDGILKSCSWDAVLHRQPWPPPKHFGMQGNGVQLRPTPWPSFIARRVRMLVLNRDRICFKVHWPLPSCVCGAVSNMNLLFHDGASILLALVTESRWFQLFGKALHHFSCAADFLGVFELNFSNTLSGGLLLNTHQLCFSQFWQLTWQSLPHKNFKGKVIELGVQCGQHCHELLKPAGQGDKFNRESAIGSFLSSHSAILLEVIGDGVHHRNASMDTCSSDCLHHAWCFLVKCPLHFLSWVVAVQWPHLPSVRQQQNSVGLWASKLEMFHMHPFLLYPAASKDKHKEIDIQVSAIGEDSVGVLELQSPWLLPGFAGMLHELQHHDSKPMTVRQVAVTSWHLYPNIAILFSTSIVWIGFYCNHGHPLDLILLQPGHCLLVGYICTMLFSGTSGGRKYAPMMFWASTWRFTLGIILICSCIRSVTRIAWVNF